MTTAIIGVGLLGSALARNLVGGGEAVVLAARDEDHAARLANDLGPLARAASVSQAIAAADTVVFAVWLDTLTSLVSDNADVLKGKVVLDPTNPIRVDGSGALVRSLPEGQSIARSRRAPIDRHGAPCSSMRPTTRRQLRLLSA
jgi:8-hydroxy-5-deazaflavin:NADPH oxidoreductase